MDDNRLILLDGGMGTMLQQAGLPLGELPESWNITHPEIVTGIHRRYAEAGSQVLYANTFGANRRKAASSGYTAEELVTAGVRCAKEAAGGRAQVALDVGPIGQLMEPLGPMSFEEAYEIFREIVTAGAAAGADRIVFETMSDLQELRAGILAAKENCGLPVWATMTFEASGRTFLGTTVSAMALTLQGLGVERPAELAPFFQSLVHIGAWTAMLPVGFLMDFGGAKHYLKYTLDLCAIRFFLVPAFVFFSSRLVFQDPVLLNTFVILATTPTAINAVLASKLYQLRTDLAVCSFILTTFLYLVVVFPLLFFLLK